MRIIDDANHFSKEVTPSDAQPDRWMADPIKRDIRASENAQLRKGFKVSWARRLLLVILDTILITCAWYLAVASGTHLVSIWTQAQGMKLLPLVIAIEVAVISANGLYEQGEFRRNYGQVVRAITFACLLLLLIAFLHEPNRYVSRSTFLLFWFMSVTFVTLGRYGFDIAVNRVRAQGAVRHAVFLICAADEREKSINLIQRCNHYNILGVADSSQLDLNQRDSTFAELKSLGIEEVFVSWSAIQNRPYLYWHFRSQGIALHILLTQNQFLLPRSEFFLAEGVPCLKIETPAITGAEFRIKRCFDFCCAVLLVTLLLPVYVLIALLIRLDTPGPVFFRQTRIGLHCKEFKVWKFRTMVTDADRIQAALEAKNEVKDGVLFKMKDDPRITHVGRFLRSYSLDELPQIFNVLLGEMSFVGPRPLPVRDVQRFKEHHFIRQDVLPGITGLWQVSGRSNITSFEEAVALDLSYIESWSLWLDLQIMLKTVQVVLQKTGAY